MGRVERIGRGGNADVYKAQVRKDGTEFVVAVKEPRFQQETIHADIVKRFVNEAETWANLDSHTHIVDVIDWDSTPLPWIALEFMDGGSLRERIDKIEPHEALWIGIDTANAIRHAHRHGVAHLDLKPENILFRQTGADYWDVPKVSDWGLARLMLDQSQSIEGVSPTYAAPEQFDPDTYGTPDDFTDIYQLGVVLYEVLTGEPPFTGSATSVMRAILEETPPPPTSKRPDLPKETDEILTTALAKEKTNRYESIIDFRRALEDLADSIDSSTEAILEREPNQRRSTDSISTTKGVSTPSNQTSDVSDDTSATSSSAVGADEDGTATTSEGRGRHSRRTMLKAGAGLATVAAVGAGTTLFQGSDGETNDISSGTDSSDNANDSSAGTTEGTVPLSADMWEVRSGDSDNWEFKGNRARHTAPQGTHAWLPDINIRDGSFAAEISSLDGRGGNHLSWRVEKEDQKDYYWFGAKQLSGFGEGPQIHWGYVVNGDGREQEELSVDASPVTLELEEFHDYRVEFNKTTHQMYINDELIFDVSDGTITSAGRLGLRVGHDKIIRNVRYSEA